MMSDNKEIVKTRMEKILNSTEKNQKELAEMCGILPNDISKAISKGDLSVSKAMKISQATGFSLDYIYGNSDIENIQRYVLDTMEQHIYPHISRISESDELKYLIPSLSTSPSLNAYFKAIFEVEKMKYFDSNQIENFKQEKRDKFFETIRTDKVDKFNDTNTYALVTHKKLLSKENVLSFYRDTQDDTE